MGSSHFVEHLSANGALRDQVGAYLNMDMIGRLGEKLYLQGTGSSSIWAREIERRNVPVGVPIATKEDPYLPTDSTPFYLKGVPVLKAFTGAHDAFGEGLAAHKQDFVYEKNPAANASLFTIISPCDFNSLTLLIAFEKTVNCRIGANHLRFRIMTQLPEENRVDDSD